METTPDSFINRAQAGLVIAGDYQLELREKFEEIAPHESCGNLVTAGQRLYLRFSPPCAIFRLDGGDESGSAQTRQVGRVLLGRIRRER